MSGFRCDVGDICALLGYYAASNGNPLLKFRDNVSVPSSGVKKSKKKIFLDPWRWNRYVVPKPDTLSRNVGKELTPCNNPEERRTRRFDSRTSSDLAQLALTFCFYHNHLCRSTQGVVFWRVRSCSRELEFARVRFYRNQSLSPRLTVPPANVSTFWSRRTHNMIAAFYWHFA
jgi:hypothetical protein